MKNRVRLLSQVNRQLDASWVALKAISSDLEGTTLEDHGKAIEDLLGALQGLNDRAVSLKHELIREGE